MDFCCSKGAEAWEPDFMDFCFSKGVEAWEPDFVVSCCTNVKEEWVAMSRHCDTHGAFSDRQEQVRSVVFISSSSE